MTAASARIAVFGAGLVGRRCASMLASRDIEVCLVTQKRDSVPLEGVTTVRGWPHRAAADATVIVLAVENQHQFALAKELVGAGAHVVATADGPSVVERLWTLDALARTKRATLAVGAGYSPGVSTLLVSYLARAFDDISVISTARLGTGGPACAREHHRSMASSAIEIHDGAARQVHAGSGRQLVWFPEPIGAADCYRAGLADPFVLHQAFPAVARIESRQAATRRDRLTARLPMLRPPHAEGLLGATWAEVRGLRDGRVEHEMMAASGPQATGAAAMAAAFVDEIRHEGVGPGAASAASFENPVPVLASVAKGVRLWTYDGARAVAKMDEATPIHAARKWRGAREFLAITTNR